MAPKRPTSAKTNRTKAAKSATERTTERSDARTADPPPAPAKTARRVASATARQTAAVAPAPRRESAARPTSEDIARRAYALFMASGCEHGHDVEHWLQAERELSVTRPRRRSAAG